VGLGSQVAVNERFPSGIERDWPSTNWRIGTEKNGMGPFFMDEIRIQAAMETRRLSCTGSKNSESEASPQGLAASFKRIAYRSTSTSPSTSSDAGVQRTGEEP
jgi:hypothetical protein